MVESSLLSLYQWYNNMHYYGHYSIADLNEMLPFERDIFFGLLSKTIDEQNKHK